MLNKIKEIAQNYTVLYVEDDQNTQKSMHNILKIIFNKVTVANNGQEGYEKFKSKSTDLIISDITMPLMNGIEMAKAIRQTDKHVPIILFTAFNDKEYLFDAIDIGIDRYINKPLNQENFFQALESILQRLEDEKMAKVYQQELIEKEINKAALDTLKQTTQIYPNPTFIYKENSLYFINKAATKLCQFENFEDFATNSNSIEKKIISKEGFLNSFFDYDPLHVKKNRIFWKTLSGRHKIFLLNRQDIDDLQVYSLSDITRIEYEKQRNRYLLDYLFDTLNRVRSKKAVPKKPLIEKNKEPEKLIIKQEVKEKTYDDIRLEAMHNNHKETASQYIQTLEDGMLEELAEMEELENDLTTKVENLQESFVLEDIHNYGLLINNYAKIVSSLVEFEDLAFSLEKIAVFLGSLENLEFNKEKLLIILASIQEDLKYWRNNIFVKQEAQDIHYLDASLLSSCLQIEKEFVNKIEDDNNDDLEFF